MRKFFAFMVAAVFTVGLVGCGDAKKPPEPTKPADTKPAEPKKEEAKKEEPKKEEAKK